MKIKLAKTAGFCMGVRRAVEMVLDAPNKYEGPICTFGPLIHNPQVLELLKEKGISALHDIPDQGSGTILIRAHGVPPESKERLEKAGFCIIDATCPRVIKVQTIIRKHAKQGYASIIIGDRDHPADNDKTWARARARAGARDAFESRFPIGGNRAYPKTESRASATARALA